MADRVWKGVHWLGNWVLKSTMLDKYVDSSNPSMRKVDNGEKKERDNKLGLSCAKLRQANLLSLLLFVNSQLYKSEVNNVR